MLPTTLSKADSTRTGIYFRHRSIKLFTKPLHSISCWILVFWASVWWPMAHRLSATYSSSSTPDLTRLARMGMAAFICWYFGLGVPLHRMDTAQTPCCNIATLWVSLIALSTMSMAPMFKTASLSLGQSAAIFPSPHMACSETWGVFWAMTSRNTSRPFLSTMDWHWVVLPQAMLVRVQVAYNCSWGSCFWPINFSKTGTQPRSMTFCISSKF